MTLDPNNSFADLVPSAGAGSEAGFTGYIPGSPKPKTKEPPSGYRWAADGINLEPIGGGPADKEDKEPKAVEAEKKAAFLTTNLTANIAILNGAIKADSSAAKPTWGQWAAGFFGEDAKNQVTPAQRQVVESSQRLITDAALTLGTGAAYTKEQIEAYRRGFFPQLGDSPEAIEAKKKSLKAALLAARISAGSQAGKVDEAIAQLGLADVQVAAAVPGATGGGESDPGMGQLSPDQERAYSAFIDSFGGKPPPDKLKAFLENLTGKQINNADAIAGALAEGRGFSATTENLTEQEKVRQRIEQEDAAGRAPNQIQTLVGQGATLNLSDEAAGIGNAAANVITSPFTGNFDPAGSYRVGRDVERQRIADARQDLGWAGTGLEVAGSVLGVSPNNAVAALVRPTNAQLVKGAAAGGAVAGFGGGEGAQQSALGAMFGGAAGAGLQAVGGRVIDRFARSGGRGLDPEAAAAAQAEGVDLIRPMVDAKSRGKFGALESSPYSQNRIREGLDKTRGQIEGRVGDLAPGGIAMETEAAGQVVQDAAQRFIKRSKGVANTLYNRARNLAGDAKVTPKAALAQLRTELMALRETPTVNQGEIDFITELGEDLAAGPLSVDAIRNLRASIRGRINEKGLTASQADARAVRIIDSLQQDVAASLPPAAATAFRRADSFYRERMIHIDDVVDRFIGGKGGTARLSGEQAFAKLKGMTSPGGDNRRLAALMRDLEPAERQDIAATIAQSIGRRAPDEPFQLGKFLEQSSKLSPAARRTIFGADGAQSIENLRTLATRLKDAGGDFNASRTTPNALRNLAGPFIANLTGLGGGAAVAGSTGAAVGTGIAAAGIAAGAVRKTLSARAMLNPRVSMWLAQAANAATPRQGQEVLRYLGVIIAREPAIAAELRPLHDFLSQRLTPSLAAEPKAEGDDDEQR